MNFALYNLIVKFFLVTALVVPGGPQLLQGEDFKQAQQAYEQTLEEREALTNQLVEHEVEYRTLLEQVDLIKSEPNTLQNRMELEELLREGRQLANQMQALQGRIRKLEERLGEQRRQLSAVVEARMAKLESRLSEAPAAERAEIVEELNELRVERQRYTSPLPSGPADEQLEETLAMLDHLDGASAADLLAAADEIEDTEDQVRTRLEAIGGRLSELHRARMLARRARTFSTEDSFFDEGDRSRFIAQYQSGGNDQMAAGDGANNTNDGFTGEDERGGVGNNGGVGAEAPAQDSPDPNFDAAPGADDGMSGDEGDDLSDQPEPVAEAPEATDDSDTSGGSEDPFGSDDDLLVDSEADPDRAVGSGFESDHNLDARIRKLEAERKRLEEQARELEQKAGQLRDRAHDTLD
jgi:hypothetical protein